MISLILSVYNNENTLAETIESILSQTYDDFEFIIINDCSVDCSVEILKAHQKIDTRIIFIENNINLGLPKSLNKAMLMVNGCFIARMDADDICEPNRFKVQLEYMLAHPDVDILGSNAILIDMQSNVIGETDMPLDHESIVKALEYRNPMIHPTIIMKRVVLEKLGGYDESLRKAQDLDLWHRAAKAGFKFANLPDCLIQYRVDLDKPAKTIIKGFRVSFGHAARNKSLKGMVLSVVDLVKYFLIKFHLYTPRSLRGKS